MSGITNSMFRLLTTSVRFTESAIHLSGSPGSAQLRTGTQTNNCLILAEQHRKQKIVILTPLGDIRCAGSTDDSIRKAISEYTECKMICPKYIASGIPCGPYWLMTGFKGIRIPCPSIDLLPPHSPIITDTEWSSGSRGQSSKSICARVGLEPYLDQLNKFYKKREDYTEFRAVQNMWNELLDMWISAGLIRARDISE